MPIKAICTAVWTLLMLPTLALGEEAFIIPGVDFSRLAFTTGSWCRYLVVDEALGIEDSTEVYIAIPSRKEIPGGEAFWVEIENIPLGEAGAEREIFKLLVAEAIMSASPKDSLVKYVLEFYIKKGHEPIQPEDPARLRDFPLGSSAPDSLWNVVPRVSVSTSAGSFSCERKERSIISEREIPAGRVKLVKKRDDHWAVWFSEDVPIFHLVKCIIDRSEETVTVPVVPGIPSSGRRESQTIAELISYGYDAGSILPIDP